MQGRSPDSKQTQFLAPTLKELLNPKEPIYRLADQIPWEQLEKEFGSLYARTGRPAKPIRLMVSLLLLKQMFDLGDETVVAAWVQNPYWQYFSGEAVFQWRLPVEPSDLVHFRDRIGEAGVKKVLQMSIALHGRKALEKEVVIDTTVQEKNITYPTDTKLRRKIIGHCVKIAKGEGVVLRQSYQRTVKRLLLAQRWRHHPKNFKKAQKAARKLKTIAGRLVRELGRKLSEAAKEVYRERLQLFEQVLAQKRQDKNKIYSLHEPEVYCVGKGKEHKKYEFGAKASVVMARNSGIIVGALSLEENEYDGHTLPEVLEQTRELTSQTPTVAIVDRGYRGKKEVDGTQILSPQRGGKEQSAAQKQKMRKRFRRRAAIEPVIGHLKNQFGLARNFLKGTVGDSVNLMLAAAAFNLKKWLNRAASFLALFIFQLLRPFYTSLPSLQKCF
jgi:IS5 family transposase